MDRRSIRFDCWEKDGMMTWCNAHDAKKNATSKKNHTMNLGNPGRHLKLRSWGVIILHHYKRISSRDLGWHRIENGRGRGKTKLLLWQTSETREPWEVKQFWEENTMEMNEVEKHSVRKEEQGTLWEPCRLTDIRKGFQWTRSTCKHSGWNKMYKEREKNQLRQHSG